MFAINLWYKLFLNIPLSVSIFKSLYIIGGGCQDNYLNYLTAKETNLQVFAGPIEATAIGNIGCQMLNKKYFNSVKEFRNFIFKSFNIKKF